MSGKARPMLDREAADQLRETKRDMSAFEQRDLTLSDVVERLVAWWRGEPLPGSRADQLDGHAADQTEAMST